MRIVPAAALCAALALGLPSAQALAMELIVNDDAGGNAAEPAPCDLTPDHTTVQGAIGAALAGDAILICPGGYPEDLQIFTDGLTLEGVVPGAAVVKGVATEAEADFPLAAPNIDLQANGVTIRNLTIESPDSQDGRYASGLVIDGTGNRILRNSFLVSEGDPGSVAIQTWAGTNGSQGLQDISGLNIKRNSFESLADAGAPGDLTFGYEGIFINPQELPEEGAVKVMRNSFSGAVYRALGVARPKVKAHRNTMVTDLPVADTLDFGVVPLGIKLFDGGKHSVKRNRIEGSDTGTVAAGLTINDPSNKSTVVGNWIAAEFGIVVESDRHKLVKNRITAGDTGIAVLGGMRNNLVNNGITCADGAVGVFLDPDSARNRLKNNRFVNCGATPVDDQGTGNRVKNKRRGPK